MLPLNVMLIGHTLTWFGFFDDGGRHSVMAIVDFLHGLRCRCLEQQRRLGLDELVSHISGLIKQIGFG